MRRLVYTLLLVLLLLLLAAPALADASGTAPPAVGYSWDDLGTIAGATAGVLLIVQFSKGWIDKIGHMPTRLYVYTLSLTILIVARAFSGGIAWADVPLTFINAFIVATAAMGSYELTFSRTDKEPDYNDDA